MNFEIRYLTEYRYTQPVMDNLNALRVKPATTTTQRCDHFHVRTGPETRLQRHVDYFGTEVIEFGIPDPHDHLTIDVRAQVVTATPDAPSHGPWEALLGDSYRAVSTEFLLQTEQQPANGALDDLQRTTRADSPLATEELLCELIPDRFEYRPGSSYVGSTTLDLFAGGAGVCQDFVHAALMVLRRLGIAARYVSGYLFAAPAEGDTDSVEVHTHAWLEALVPGLSGGAPVWVAADPTNGGLCGERHVKIGHGRHYADVPPIKGVYRGTCEADFDARVEMRRVNGTQAPRP
jgi:transglutaminase-like putative cysteine protease